MTVSIVFEFFKSHTLGNRNKARTFQLFLFVFWKHLKIIKEERKKEKEKKI